MSLLARQSIEIQCPIAPLFTYVINMEHFGEWFPEVVTIRSHNDRNHGDVGKTYLETVRVPPSETADIVIEVVRCELNQSFTTEGAFEPLRPRMTIELEPVTPETVRLTWAMETRATDPEIRDRMVNLFGPVMSARAETALQRLKARHENSSEPVA
ncbi:SRPBCC family protein [Sulfidibacter corallicola]|uniref:SRPBCC family protein n=1 Tax=Sulfidibacter corallicola TaxID=2818388 RepID=A0A8A4TZB9_SULCO|nr:SRPBCC family protein [Sulfidibacter corallicola]QTD51855.1 SRPBCC family protein [Sulfidibacter corallicola]